MNLISNLVAWPVQRGQVRLSWDVNQGDWPVIQVFRDPGDGIFVQIAKVSGQEQYLDKKAPTASLTRTIRYQLVAEGTDAVFGPVRMGITQPDQLADRLLNDFELGLQGWGQAAAHFSIKSTPMNCSCYNVVSQAAEDPDCRECGGSGKQAGYADPVIDYVLPVTPKPKTNNVTELGEIQRYGQMLESSGAVLAKPNDMIVMPTSERLRVVSVQEMQVHGFVTKQHLQCVSFNPSDREYDFQVPDAILAVMRHPPRASMFVA